MLKEKGDEQGGAGPQVLSGAGDTAELGPEGATGGIQNEEGEQIFSSGPLPTHRGNFRSSIGMRVLLRETSRSSLGWLC